MRGRRIETIRIGKMPGDQVTIYDKHADCRVNGKDYWHYACGLTSEDRSYQIWRVELRAGKHGLLRKHGIATFEALESQANEILSEICQATRYAVQNKNDDNVTRWPTHPFLLHAKRNIPGRFGASRPKLSPRLIEEAERNRLREIYAQLILGNAAGYAGLLEGPIERIPALLPGIIHDLVEQSLEEGAKRKKVVQVAKKIRDRMWP